MKPSKFSNVPRALLPALLLTIFMSSGSVARSIDEPPIDTFSSKEGANKQVISSQADSLIKISRIWADF
ncbi:hypothetical protein RZR41_26445, partial [Raoultella ornithinolytica]